MAYIKEEDYKHPLPFDNTVGKDAFRFVPTAPPVADVDEEFKTQFAYKRKITLKDRGVMYPYTEEQKAELKKCKYDIFYFLENYAHIISLDDGIIKFQPYQYQKNMIKVMDENRFSIFMLPRQMGKPLNICTIIHTTTGTKKLHEIEIDDYVYNRRGDQVRVTYITPIQYNKKCYKMIFSNGQEIIADAEHVWSIDGHGEVTTEDILNIDKPTIYRPAIPHLIKDSTDTHISITSIIETDSVPVMCIGVDDDEHIFLIGENMIPTHNCTVDETLITIRSKKSGIEEDISIGDFYKKCKKALN